MATNPGSYPAVVDPDAQTWEHQIAEHKFETQEFKTYLGIANALWQKICEAVDKEWFEGICHAAMCFAHLTPIQMLDHLKTGRAVLDYIDLS